MPKKESLQKNILRTILLLVLIPMGVIATISIIQISILGGNIGQNGANSLQIENINALQNKSVDTATYVHNYFQAVEIDLDRLATYETQLFNGDLNITNYIRSSYN
jgi:hypothetical protein